MTDRVRLIDAAISLLRSQGWRQHWRHDSPPDGPLTAYAALKAAAGFYAATERDERDDARHAAMAVAWAFQKRGGKIRGWDLTTFNDTPGRTADEVIAMLETT